MLDSGPANRLVIAVQCLKKKTVPSWQYFLSIINTCVAPFREGGEGVFELACVLVCVCACACLLAMQHYRGAADCLLHGEPHGDQQGADPYWGGGVALSALNTFVDPDLKSRSCAFKFQAS